MAGRTTQQPEEPQQAEDEVTTPESLGFVRPEIEVERIQLQQQTPASDGTVQIRMGRTIEEFTFGNPHVNYKLEEGKIYKMPLGIATYLDSLGALYH